MLSSRRTWLPRLTVLGPLLLSGCLAAPGYRGPPIEGRFDGEQFANQIPLPAKELSDFLRWRLERDPGPWEDRTDEPAGPPPPERVCGPGQLRVTLIGHATVLVQMDGINLLTDPVYSDRVGPYDFLGPKRMRPPGIRWQDLPRIDAVVISHNHYDHLDLNTLARLADRDRPVMVAGLGTRALLDERGIAGGVDLDWWQTVQISETVEITAVPAQHWSKRGLADDRNTLWAGYVLSGTGGPVYFAGDTGWGPHFAQVRERFGPARLALLPIGAFRPRWFMKAMHISPVEAAAAARLLEAEVMVPVHYGTFPLGDDGMDEARDALVAHVERSVDGDRFQVLDFGRALALPPAAAAPVLASGPGSACESVRLD